MSKWYKKALSLVCALSLLVASMAVGVTFGAAADGEYIKFFTNSFHNRHDTYAALSNPLTEAPTTFEATVNMLPYANEWNIDSFLTERYGESENLKTAAAGDNTDLAAGTKYLELNMTSGGHVHPIGTWNGAFTPPAVSTPYTDTLALSFKLWFSKDMASINTQVDLSSNKETRNPLMNKAHSFGALKAGWNVVVIPFKDFPEYATMGHEVIRAQDINFFRMWNWNANAVDGGEYTMRFAELKVVDTAAPMDDSELLASETAIESDVNLSAKDYAVFTNYIGKGDYNNVYGLYVLQEGYPALVYGGRQYTFKANVAAGKDVHMSLVKDGDKFTLYVDGKDPQSTPVVTVAAPKITSAHAIGANQDGGMLMLGQIGNLRVWNDVRTAAEVKGSVAFSSLSKDQQGLVGAWELKGNITHILEEMPDLNEKNPVVFKGSRRDQWINYEIPEEIGNDYATMVWIPDPQNITIPKAKHIWYEDMQWIADNVENENIVHVMSAGDNTWNNDHETWGRVVEGFEKFWDKVSWSAIAGNHDYVWSAKVRDTRNYNQHLGLDVIKETAAKDTFKGWYDEGEDAYTTFASGVENSYYEVKVGETDWLILQLEMYPRLSVIEWAEGVLKEYPNHNVLIATHSQLGPKSSYNIDGYDYFAEEKEHGDFTESMEVLYTDLVEPYSNVKMVLCGHSDNPDGEQAILSRNYQREDGSVVYQMMVNAQYLDTDDETNYNYYNDRCVGMLGLLRFSQDGSRVAFQWYCPTDDMTYEPYPDGDNPAITMGPCYISQSNFVLPLNEATYEAMLLQGTVNEYPSLYNEAALLDDEVVKNYYLALAEAKAAITNTYLESEDVLAVKEKLAAAYEALFSVSDIASVDFTGGKAVTNDLVNGVELDNNNKGVEIKEFDGAHALFCGNQGEHNYVTLDLSNFVDTISKEVHVKITYRTTSTDQMWTTIVAGKSYGKRDSANYTYIGNTQDVAHHMGPLTMSEWAEATFDFADLSTATYGKKLVLGGNPMGGIYIAKIEVMSKATGAIVDELAENIAEAEAVLKNTIDETLEKAYDAAAFVQENVTDSAALKAASEKLTAALTVTERADKSALVEALSNVITKFDGKTATSVADYWVAVADVYALLNDATADKAAVDAGVTALTNAVELLKDRTDFAALEEKLAAEADRKMDLYKYDSQMAYRAALEQLKDLRKDPNATDETVAAGIAKFEGVVASLERLIVTKTGLQGEVDKAPVSLDGYTPETAESYRAALEIAKEILAVDNYTQTEVDQAHRALLQARLKLQLLPLDKTELQKMVDNARTDLHRFEKELADAYTAALEAAKEVLASETVTQADVMVALNALKAADEALVVDIELGDVNGDGNVDSTDARLTLQYFVGSIKKENLDLIAANVNADAKVDSTDARLILQYFVGSITEFPVEG